MESNGLTERKRMRDKIIRPLVSQGAKQIGIDTNCPSLDEALPVLRFNLGDGDNSVQIPLIGRDYLQRHLTGSGECTLKIVRKLRVILKTNIF